MFRARPVRSFAAAPGVSFDKLAIHWRDDERPICTLQPRHSRHTRADDCDFVGDVHRLHPTASHRLTARRVALGHLEAQQHRIPAHQGGELGARLHVLAGLDVARLQRAGDVARLLACLTDDAVLVNPRGETARGHTEIKRELGALLDGRGRGSKHVSSISRVAFVTPDVAVAIDEVFDRKIDMLDAHVSQMYEWLPWHAGILEQVPSDPEARKRWLAERRAAAITPAVREALIRWYGPERGRQVQHAEAFELCEYGARVTEADLRRLFPFFH